MAKILSSTTKHISSFITRLDMYPLKINFTFNGKGEFRNVFGGIASLIIQILVFLYALTMLLVLINNRDNSKNMNLIVQNILNDTTPLNLENTTFQWAIQATVGGIEYNVFDSPQYMKGAILQGEYHRSPLNLEITEIPVSKCGNNFKYDKPEEVEQLGIPNHYCPDTANFSIFGNTLSSSNRYFEFSLSRCDNATSSVTCADNSTIDDIFKRMEIRIYAVNTYFDFDDYENPIKTFIDDRFLLYPIPGFTRVKAVKLQQNKAEIDNNYFRWQPGGDEEEFISFENIEDLITVEGQQTNKILSFSFIKDYHTKVYERSVFTILEAVGNVGGLFEALFVFGKLVPIIFSQRLLFYRFFSKIYQIERSEAPEADSNITDGKIHNCNEAENTRRNLALNDGYQGRKKQELVEEVKKVLQSRRKYNWNFKDLCYNASGWLRCTISCCIRKKNNFNINKRLKLFKKAQKKCAYEFDAVQFSKNMRNLKALVRSLLDDSEKFMIRNQKTHVLLVDESSSDVNKSDEDDKVPKLFSKLIHKVIHRLHIKEKLDTFMKEHWNEKDYRIASGVISKKPLNNLSLEEMMRRSVSLPPITSCKEIPFISQFKEKKIEKAKPLSEFKKEESKYNINESFSLSSLESGARTFNHPKDQVYSIEDA